MNCFLRTRKKMRCKIHKYKKIKNGDKITWKCVNCPHSVQGKMVLGRSSICWKCGNSFTISNYNILYHTFPNCGCTSKKKASIPVFQPQKHTHLELLSFLTSIAWRKCSGVFCSMLFLIRYKNQL